MNEEQKARLINKIMCNAFGHDFDDEEKEITWLGFGPTVIGYACHRCGIIKEGWKVKR